MEEAYIRLNDGNTIPRIIALNDIGDFSNRPMTWKHIPLYMYVINPQESKEHKYVTIYIYIYTSIWTRAMHGLNKRMCE